ncbi:winged helix-turn-helix transcriptional regulator [Nonomuraea roseoviolacea]|uniref:DNA-binding HxlR family transcriptional regulator n=1 Tax=Nonomuraea roseoviolacea subsp. carminata TaxID=160689 RepID=A0ABT1K5M5_9ACTN|nr:helix-turn-helix domain-containing protein [Nonomuraea roseoviolacea]MCP2349307.1 DNA-binding HxlR family transcriptional regulator [Nonomuraea roseoviolacea subsp. carminata]
MNADGPAGGASSVLQARDETTCQVRDVLNRVGDKWTLSVVNELGAGPRRFNELRRTVPGISQRMLTATLRVLERDGLVTRSVYAEVPPRVDYELTPLGRTLLERVWGLIDWVIEHHEDIEGARSRYDARRAPDGSQPTETIGT